MHGVPGDGWMLTQEAGATTETPNYIPMVYDFKYTHTLDEKGKLKTKKIVYKYEKIPHDN
jgi:hypothetical protein